MALKPNFFNAVGVAVLLYKAWAYFKNQGRLLSKWNYDVKGMRILNVTGSFMDLELSLDVINKSNINAIVTDIDLDVFVDGKLLGRAQSTDLFFFQPYGTTNIKIRFRTSSGSIYTAAKAALTGGVNMPIRLTGGMQLETLKGVYIPVPINFTQPLSYFIFD